MPKLIDGFDFDIGAHRIQKMYIQRSVVFEKYLEIRVESTVQILHNGRVWVG